MKENKIWKKLLSALLILQIVVACALGIFTLVNFAGFLEQFGVKYQLDMGTLQNIMSYNLFLSLSICLLGVIWIRKNNIAGIQIATTIGFLMFVFSLVVFIKFDKWDILLFDGVRSFLMIIFGILAYREHKKINP